MPTPKTTPRERMIEKSRKWQIGTYVSRYVAPEFQRMIRAEYGAQPAGYAPAIIDNCVRQVYRKLGKCVCVTCGAVKAWCGGLGGMHTGHFTGSRRNAILFLPQNAFPQCPSCNRYRNGMPEQFHLWMLHVHGAAVIAELEALKRTTRTFSREELVDMRIEFKRRLKAAEAAMIS